MQDIKSGPIIRLHYIYIYIYVIYVMVIDRVSLYQKGFVDEK